MKRGDTVFDRISFFMNVSLFGKVLTHIWAWSDSPDFQSKPLLRLSSFVIDLISCHESVKYK